MTDADALLATILARPEDDLPRLVYADYLEENGDGERGEFIRVQCELTKHWHGVGNCTCRQLIDKYHCDNCLTWDLTEELRDRERELFASLPHDLPDGVFRCVSTVAYRYSRLKSDPLMIYDRGFVSEVHAPLAVLFGGECDRCGGNRHEYNQPGVFYHDSDPCRDCSGTGRTEGIAKRLFETMPVLRVDIVNAEPMHFTGRLRRVYAWVGGQHGETTPYALPSDLFSLIDWDEANPSDHSHGYVGWETRDLAITALSDAAVRLGRLRAGIRVDEPVRS